MIPHLAFNAPPHVIFPSTEAFIRNFSAPSSLLQRHLVGEEDSKQGTEEGQQVNAHQVAHPIIAELTTSSFLPYVMDVQKVRTRVGCVAWKVFGDVIARCKVCPNSEFSLYINIMYIIFPAN